MRMKKPVRALIDQARVTRDGNDAIIEYADPEISDIRLTIGPQIKTMTDSDIVDVFNSIMDAQEKPLRGWNKGISKNTPSARPANQIQRISLNLTTGSGCDGAIGFL